MTPEQLQEAMDRLRAECITLTDEDCILLNRITIHVDRPLRCVKLLRQYYQDLHRAERTPRSLLYLHLGILMGLFIHDEN